PALHRRPRAPARQRPRRDEPLRGPRQHRRGPGALVRVRRRPAVGGALLRHPRGDVPAADHDRHGGVDRGHGPRLLPAALRLPDELRGLVGVWWSEGSAFTFSVRQGRLEARAVGLPDHKPASRFEQLEPDVFRTVAGREEGELLRVTRDADGTPYKLSWATYL